ncbi:hypothetical protein P885DRAFT_26501 [Corynascus similis CBS 632.67]
MFITLRTSGSRDEAGGMEQVVRRNASPGGVKDRVRPTTRRPACVACQTKKLRCTGSPRNCDRCRARLIECVFPASGGSSGRQDNHNQRTHSSHTSQTSNSSRLAWQKQGDVSPQRQGDPSRNSSSGSTSADGPINLTSNKPPSPLQQHQHQHQQQQQQQQQHQNQQQQQHPGIPGLRAPAGVDPLDGDLFDLNAVDGLDIDMVDEISREGVTLDIRSGMSSANSGSSDPYHPGKSPQQDNYDALGSYLSSALAQDKSAAVQQGQARTLSDTTTTTINTTAQELPSMLALDAPPLSPSQSWALTGVPPAPNLNRTSSPPCSCLSDLVRVVQQLDDDEFHITTMSLDQVLHLQKWLVFQCCKPLDCPKCLDLPTIHTVRLILCDRLTEMFECIHLRVKRAGAILASAGSDVSSNPSSASSSSQSPDSLRPVRPSPTNAAAVGSGPLPAQLFCGSSGRAANTAACNPLMFSDDFRNQYSDEEQVHMIRVLLRLQIRNFRKLLLRLERTCQGAANQARQSKVESMMVRLSKASADIEGALRVIFHALSIG